MTKKIILDLDTGIDDALAIAYALGSPELDLIGITATYGNVTVGRSVRNSLAVLELLGRTDVPVFAGVGHSLTTDSFTPSELSAFIHGGNGIGEIEIPTAGRNVEQQTATDFIIESAHRYGEDLTCIPTGAATNIVAALEKDPTIKDAMGPIVMMGGALTTEGNVNKWTEANVSQDPEATDRLFRSGAEVVMVGLDVTHQTLLTKAETSTWRDFGTEAGRCYADMTDYYIDFETKAMDIAGCGLHDPLAVAVAADRSLVTLLPITMQVDLEGPTRGRTIGSLAGLSDPVKTVGVAVEVDVERFLGEFMTRVGSVLSVGPEGRGGSAPGCPRA
ncbi:nucleoside hydrolase [Propionibacterium acidifaciens]|uniref:nucleoside hydrolase n=1 Tax=Propionibacterium acidifaciens TaxID=556499 RepID=UPI00361A843D